MCTEATLRGTYGIQIQGTRPAPPPAPAGSIETVISVIVRQDDDKGQFTQINNQNGSISGIGPADREGFGTYQVNEDCSGSHQLQIPGVPNSINGAVCDRGSRPRGAALRAHSNARDGDGRLPEDLRSVVAGWCAKRAARRVGGP